MLQLGKFYQTKQNHNLLENDLAGEDTRRNGKVMQIVPMGATVLLTKRGRWRYVQVIYLDMVGYIWVPTNVPTHEVFELIDIEDLNKSIRGPFVRPTKPKR